MIDKARGLLIVHSGRRRRRRVPGAGVSGINGLTVGAASLILLTASLVCGFGLPGFPAAPSHSPLSLASWVLWPSPYDDAEQIDQQQTVRNDDIWTQVSKGSCGAVGQQFVPTRSPLVRVDLMVDRRGDSRPGTFKIWRWTDSHESTVASTPLFADTLDLTGMDGHQVRSFFPRVDVVPGRTYYFEIAGPDRDPIKVADNHDGTDRYPAGVLWTSCNLQPANLGDLWFRTYSMVLPAAAGRDLDALQGDGSLPSRAEGASLGRRRPHFEGSEPSPRWVEPDRDGTVTKLDYYSRVSGFESSHRCEATGGCGAASRFYVLNEAFLYRASCLRGSCDESCAANAIQALRRMYDWRFCDPSLRAVCNAAACRPPLADCDPAEKVGFEWMERPGIAYLWIRSSPTFDQPGFESDRRRIRELLVDSARRFWPDREAGVSNRSMGGALTYLLVTMLFPGEPEEADWRAYSERVWNEFWNKMDTEEDSAGYNDQVWWKEVLEYASIAGLDGTVWSDPRFEALIHRFYEHVAPIGVDPGYGESGWQADSNGLIWLFEKAASKYRDSGYKWMAHRIFDYNRTHACNPPEAGDSYQNDMTPLCWAYLDADEGVPDVRPPPQSEVRAARQEESATRLWEGGPATRGAREEKTPKRMAGKERAVRGEHPGMVRDASANDARIGQTFRPTATPLVRIDLDVRSEAAHQKKSRVPAAAVLKLWKWSKDRETTVAQEPLYQETVDLNPRSRADSQAAVDPGGGTGLCSFYPFLNVTVGDTYYLEIRGSSRFFCAGSDGTTDLYPGGAMWMTGQEQPAADLWFVTYTLSPNGSTYTTRLEAKPRPVSLRGSPREYFDLGEHQVPDKLVLRSGYEGSDLNAVFNLIAGEYGHGRAGAASLVSLTDGGSLILGQAGSPYWFFESLQDQDDTMAVCKRYWGGRYGAPGDRTRVSRFTDYRRATVAWIEWENLHGWRVDQERRFYFVKNRFLLIRDRFTLPEPMKASVGTVWHAADVRSRSNPADPADPDHGSNWYDVYFREPLVNIFKFRNLERYALLYFVPRPAFEVAEFKEKAYTPPECVETPPCKDVAGECRTSPPYVVYQRKITQALRGETDWFDTLILPHGRDVTPSIAAANVRVLYDDGTAVGLEIVVGNETWTVVDNPRRISISTTDLRTDASYVITRSRPGSADYVLTQDAKNLRTRTVRRTWAVKTSVESGDG